MKSLKAIGNHVVLKGITITETVVETKTKSGLVLQGETKNGQKVNDAKGGKARVKLVIDSIGEAVDTEKFKFKVGDEVFCNDMDLQTFSFDGDDIIWGVTRDISVRAVIVD